MISAFIGFIACSLIDVIRQLLLGSVEQKLIKRITSFKIFRRIS